MIDCYALMQGEFSGWLSDELNKRVWSQAEFARRAGISQTTVSRVLSGENNPGDDFIAGTARAFGVTPDTVMRRAGKLPDYGEVLPEVRDWSSRLTLLSPERREMVILAMDNVLRLAEDRPLGRQRQPRSTDAR